MDTLKSPNSYQRNVAKKVSNARLKTSLHCCMDHVSTTPEIAAVAVPNYLCKLLV